MAPWRHMRAVKRRFFSRSSNKQVIINADDAFGRQMVDLVEDKKVSLQV